jgi:hypothetical protein
MGLYDPDRLKFPQYRNPTRGPVEATWDDFRSGQAEHFKAPTATRGRAAGVHRRQEDEPDARRDEGPVLKRKWSKATWVSVGLVGLPRTDGGHADRAGRPDARAVSRSLKAKVIVSLDRDFLNERWQRAQRAGARARDWAATRNVQTAKDEMSRLYVVEIGFTITGGSADHRLRVAPSRIPAVSRWRSPGRSSRNRRSRGRRRR